MRVRYHYGAEEDVDDAFDYYRRKARSGTMEKFQQRILESEAQILEQPLMWPLFKHRCRRFLVEGFPYIIYYHVADEMITIVAVAHTSRREGYWKKRVREV